MLAIYWGGGADFRTDSLRIYFVDWIRGEERSSVRLINSRTVGFIIVGKDIVLQGVRIVTLIIGIRTVGMRLRVKAYRSRKIIDCGGGVTTCCLNIDCFKFIQSCVVDSVKCMIV